jgi:hypothetical protein
VNTALIATYHASALNLVEIVGGLGIVACLLLVAIAPRHH